MGLLDVPGISRAQADERYLPKIADSHFTAMNKSLLSAWNGATLSVTSAVNTCTATMEAGFTINGVAPVKVTQGSSGSGIARMIFAADQSLSGIENISVGFRFTSNVAATPGVPFIYLLVYYADGSFTSYRIQTSELQPGIDHVLNIPRYKYDGTAANFGGTDYFDTKLVRSFALLTDTTSNMGVGADFWLALLGADMKSKPTLLLGFDGNYIGQKTLALPLLQEFGLRATFYVQKYQLGQSGRFTEADLDYIYSLGHDVAMHSYSKDANYSDAAAFPTATLAADVAAEISGFEAWATGRGYTRGLGHACAAIANAFTPGTGSTTHARMQTLVSTLQSAGIESYRNSSGAFNQYADFNNLNLTIRPLPIHVKQINSKTAGVAGVDVYDGAEARKHVQWIVRNGMTRMLYGHDVVTSGASGTTTINRDTLYQLCDEAARQIAMGKMQNKTISELGY